MYPPLWLASYGKLLRESSIIGVNLAVFPK